MTMTHSDAAKLSHLSRKELEARINAYCQQFRPKIIRTYDENGKEVKVIEAAYAEGARGIQKIKSTARRGYEL